MGRVGSRSHFSHFHCSNSSPPFSWLFFRLFKRHPATCVCVDAHACSHPCYGCLFMPAHARMFLCEYVSLSVSVYAGHCMYVCVCVCVCVCVFSVPSTRDVSRVTLAALRRPAGRLRPIFSRRSLRQRPPFFDFALREDREREQFFRRGCLCVCVCVCVCVCERECVFVFMSFIVVCL